jgi:nicotinamidase-related amidase
MEVINTAIENGIEVIFIQADYGPSDGATDCELFRDHPDYFPCRHGSWGQELIAPLKELQQNRHLSLFSKRQYSALRNPALGDYLKERGIVNLIMVGVETDYCIGLSAEDAAGDFNVFIPGDCTTTASGIRSKTETLRQLSKNKSMEITDSETVITWLSVLGDIRRLCTEELSDKEMQAIYTRIIGKDGVTEDQLFSELLLNQSPQPLSFEEFIASLGESTPLIEELIGQAVEAYDRLDKKPLTKEEFQNLVWDSIKVIYR